MGRQWGRFFLLRKISIITIILIQGDITLEKGENKQEKREQPREQIKRYEKDQKFLIIVKSFLTKGSISFLNFF